MNADHMAGKINGEKTNFSRLAWLLVDKGGDALRAVFREQHSSATLANVLTEKKPLLEEIKGPVIKPLQWELLYPASQAPDLKNFDVTLLAVLLKHTGALKKPKTGWNKMPPEDDISVEADVVRIRQYRNSVYAHAASAQLDNAMFETLWEKISKPLVALGVLQDEIDELKKAPLSSEEEKYIELLKSWMKADQEHLAISQETLQTTKENNEILNELRDKVSEKPRVHTSEEETLGHEKSKSLKVGELDQRTYEELCDRLNWNIRGKDWKSLAGCMGYNNNKVKTYEQKPDPAHELLKYWGDTGGKDVLTLIELARQLDRADIVDLLKNALKQ